MKCNITPVVLILSFLFVAQMKAEGSLKFDPDTVPSAFSPLKNFIDNPAAYDSLWYEMKKEIEAKNADPSVGLYYLYRDRVDFHYENSQIDSLKKYVPILKDLCLRVGDEYYYYHCWDLLCEYLFFSNREDEAMDELQHMQDDASKRKSEIGLAFRTFRMGMIFAVREEFVKAQPYLEQCLKIFEEMEYWDDYILISSNYILILLHNGKKEEALSVFLHLDSIAERFIRENKLKKYIRQILMIKDMASAVYSQLYKEPKDTLILKKYMEEIEELYRKAPKEPRECLYNTKIHYATITNNVPVLIAYQDSMARHHIKSNNKVGLKDVYYELSKNLSKVHKYKDAYHTLRKYVNLSDSINKEEFRKQLNEMSVRYNVNRLELEAQKARMDARNTQYYYACAFILILVIALFVCLHFYLHKVKSNRLLKQQAQELLHANERVLKAQLMKSAFIQNMNHEIRTPLNAIVGFSECLAEIPMEPEEIREMSATIKKSSDYLLKIISDTISIANMDSDETALHYHPVSLNELLSALTTDMKEYVQPGVKLNYLPGKADYKLMSHRDTLYQILYNLLHNALKFTQSGEVEVGYQLDADAKEVRFHVRDTGPGVSSELKEKIFERFYKVDDFAQGAGLGLSLCTILAGRLKARVYLDDSYHGGCLFVLAHPLA